MHFDPKIRHPEFTEQNINPDSDPKKFQIPHYYDVNCFNWSPEKTSQENIDGLHTMLFKNIQDNERIIQMLLMQIHFRDVALMTEISSQKEEEDAHQTITEYQQKLSFVSTLTEKRDGQIMAERKGKK